jgi:uncharacterized protein (DUF1697 family)
MPTYIALLRAVNVGGNLIKMERVREIWLELGFKNVRTYVQSGNVVFEGDGKPAGWLAAIEQRFLGETRLPVSVIVRTPAELRRIVSGNPFLKDPGIDVSKLHVTFLSGAPQQQTVKALGAIDTGSDRFRVVRTEIYGHCPNGFADVKLTTKVIERVLSVKATTRNWNTVNKLLEMAAE